MSQTVQHGRIAVDATLADFVEREALPGTGIAPGAFWSAFESILIDLAPKNRALLAKRDALQAKIDEWHRARKGKLFDAADYKRFLTDIGYLVPSGADFAIETETVDPEIATMAGPQLVVPVTNARYALNAANARWGSLYDALYGTDAIPGRETAKPGYDPARGESVIAWARKFLDDSVPLAKGSWTDATALSIESGALAVASRDGTTGLADAKAFAGYRGDAAGPSTILLVHNGLHIEVVVDRTHRIGKTDGAGIADVMLESALTTIQDCEDSVATVDAADKVEAYRNWLGLMKGDLADTFEKGGETMTRRLSPDRTYTKPDGGTLTLHGRSLLLIRNVGHLMTIDAIKLRGWVRGAGRDHGRDGDVADRHARSQGKTGRHPQQPCRPLCTS